LDMLYYIPMNATKNSISNFTQAKEAIKTLADLAQSIESFIVSMEQRIDAVYALKGNPAQPDLPLQTGARLRLHNLPQKAPDTWSDRVLTIFKVAAIPLTQKDVVAVYEDSGWPKDFASSLYATISSSVAYLCRIGKLANSESGYKIPQVVVPPPRKSIPPPRPVPSGQAAN